MILVTGNSYRKIIFPFVHRVQHALSEKMKRALISNFKDQFLTLTQFMKFSF